MYISIHYSLTLFKTTILNFIQYLGLLKPLHFGNCYYFYLQANRIQQKTCFIGPLGTGSLKQWTSSFAKRADTVGFLSRPVHLKTQTESILKICALVLINKTIDKVQKIKQFFKYVIPMAERFKLRLFVQFRNHYITVDTSIKYGVYIDNVRFGILTSYTVQFCRYKSIFWNICTYLLNYRASQPRRL